MQPATKQRRGREPEPPPGPDEHLVCYGIRDLARFAPRDVFTRDQFISQRVEVTDPTRLRAVEVVADGSRRDQGQAWKSCSPVRVLGSCRRQHEMRPLSSCLGRLSERGAGFMGVRDAPH